MAIDLREVGDAQEAILRYIASQTENGADLTTLAYGLAGALAVVSDRMDHNTILERTV